MAGYIPNATDDLELLTSGTCRASWLASRKHSLASFASIDSVGYMTGAMTQQQGHLLHAAVAGGPTGAFMQQAHAPVDHSTGSMLHGFFNLANSFTHKLTVY